MSLKLACADVLFPLLDHDHVLALISLLELDGVDIGLFEAYGQNTGTTTKPA